MGAIHSSIPIWIASALYKAFGLTTFVETGLAQGASVLWARQCFAHCYSIEIDQATVDRFKKAHADIEVICGDSGAEMESLVQRINEPALFWLDGHTDDYTPVMAELRAIYSSDLDHVVMIDDLRLFGQLLAWPTYSELAAEAARGGRKTLEVDDVMIAVRSANEMRAFEMLVNPHLGLHKH